MKIHSQAIRIVPLLLAIILIIPASTISTANAAEGTLKTYPYVGVVPNPVGVGQTTLIRLGITAATSANEYGWTGLTVTITNPDGTTITLGPFKTDSTGGTYTTFTPTVVGNYTLQSFFPEQTNAANVNAAGMVIPKGTTMLASSSEEITLKVQENPIPSATYQALPTEYWSRPINNQYQSWQAIGGNWLFASDGAATLNRIAYGNENAPRSPHILWSKVLTAGGLVGGSEGYLTGDITNNRVTIGDAYQGKFLKSVIMLGVLYYDNYASTSKIHEYTAVDLHTGNELWTKSLLNNLTLTFGQLMQWNSINVVGTYPYLWATADAGTLSLLGLPSNAGKTLCAFDPYKGSFVYAMYGVPSGTTMFGDNGEILIYTVNTAKGYMTLWNSTNIPSLYAGTEIGSTNIQQWTPEGRIVNATGSAGTTFNGSPATYYMTPTGYAGYVWNATIPTGLPGSILTAIDDRIVGGTYSSSEITLWALSLDSGSYGNLLFKKTWTPPADLKDGNVTISWQAISDQSADGVVIFSSKETRQFYGFSVETGEYLWVTKPSDYLDFYTMGMGASANARSVSQIYDGKYYAAGYAGILYCYDCKTGNLLWSYTAYNEEALDSTFNQWPLYPMFIAGDMIYVIHTEHSGFEQSLPVGAPMLCINATTGEVIWRADGLIRGTHWGGYPIIGDSIIAAMNTYDMQIYAMGKGPTSITVDAPAVGVEVGDSIIISGTITDVSPGTTRDEIKLRFPNGVPAVADNNMTSWMRYIYQQTSKPTDIQGVEVTINVIDSNGNYRTIGTTTSDDSGYYNLVWTPDISGKYTVTANFAGTESYYASEAAAAFYASEPTATTSPQPTQPASLADQYILPGIIGIIIAIAVGFAVTILVLKKKP